MKKIIFTLSIAFLTFAGVQAQDTFKFGVTAGLLLNEKYFLGRVSYFL